MYPQAELRFDTSTPGDTPRKVANPDRLTATGWIALLGQLWCTCLRWTKIPGSNPRWVDCARQ